MTSSGRTRKCCQIAARIPFQACWLTLAGGTPGAGTDRSKPTAEGRRIGFA
jgi:hypothetical protein